MRDWLWFLLKKILFLFDAETIHRVMLWKIRYAAKFGHLPLRIVSGYFDAPVPESNLPIVFGIPFCSRVGLAAGFDKDAEILRGLPARGFGFAEIGTVTPKAQPGNDRPRLFRDPSSLSIFNRMGFNNLGAEKIARNLTIEKKHLPNHFRIGVNIGKNKDTPLEQARTDYAKCAAHFLDLADYLVINVSSPNTPGLRSLQKTTALRPIVEDLKEFLNRKATRPPPLLLKLGPDIPRDEWLNLMVQGEKWGIQGLVLTNTHAGIWEKNSPAPLEGGTEGGLEGGWSGKMLMEKSKNSLLEARKMTKMPIISVGGIMDEKEALDRLTLGAELIQIYTGWIYSGPSFPGKISRTIISSFRL